MSLRDFGADESADEMLAVNPDYHNLVELLGAARNDMVVRLAAAMTITRDASLRERLAEIASIDPGREFLIGQSKNQSWLKVGGCGHSISRRRQTGLPTIELDEAIRIRPEFERSLQVSMQRTGAVKDAYNVLEPLFEPSLVQSRASFHEIFEWAPARATVLQSRDAGPERSRYASLGRPPRIERNAGNQCHEPARVLAARSCAGATRPVGLKPRLAPLA